jgi:hypothetical protein
MYRIVHNEQTGDYRVEKRGLLGWSFVYDPQSSDYLTFTDRQAASAWVRQKACRGTGAARRWKVVADCDN